MNDHQRRDLPQFYSADTLPWQPSDVPALWSATVRLLSLGEDGQSATLLAKVETGWSARYDTAAAAFELFVLAGAMSVEGRHLGAGGYAIVPQGGGHAELSSTTGATAVAFWNPGLQTSDSTVRTTAVWREPWQQSVMPGAQHGAMHKSLRLPDTGDGEAHGGPGGLLRLVLMTPGYGDEREHVHPVWEEMFFLSGDLLMPNRGLIAPGSYLGNPGGFWHAPMTSQLGSLMLLQTLARIEQVPRPFARGREIVDGYRDTASYLEPPRHRAWAATGYAVDTGR